MPDETQIIRRGHGAPVLIVEDVATGTLAGRARCPHRAGWASERSSGALRTDAPYKFNPTNNAFYEKHR
ncbi:MAG: hypothetical protein WCS99_22545 [Limisphaerales bacterium]